MFRLNDLGEYEAVIDRITFVCDEVDDSFEETAVRLAEVYSSRLESIADFLLDEGISDVFGEISPDKLIKALGKPVVNLENETITYADNSLDDYCIIEFEYTGLFESFSYLNIDG
ncbi:MAG: hypothetical protein J6B17_03335 [Ruminococcus sp.]|nr:hypothetical protein [Ruminococcus sp.]